MSDDNDDNLMTLASGAIYDRSKGRIVKNEGGGVYAFTAVTGAAGARRRWEIHRRAFVDGFVEGAGGDINKGSEFAWRLVGKKIAEVILSGENNNPRGQAELVRLAAELLGNVPSKADVIETRGLAAGVPAYPGLGVKLFRLIAAKLDGADMKALTDDEYKATLMDVISDLDATKKGEND